MFKTAELLPSYCRVEKFDFYKTCLKPYFKWCQERDSNPRPQAYEVDNTAVTKTPINTAKCYYIVANKQSAILSSTSKKHTINDIIMTIIAELLPSKNTQQQSKNHTNYIKKITHLIKYYKDKL